MVLFLPNSSKMLAFSTTGMRMTVNKTESNLRWKKYTHYSKHILIILRYSIEILISSGDALLKRETVADEKKRWYKKERVYSKK